MPTHSMNGVLVGGVQDVDDFGGLYSPIPPSHQMPPGDWTRHKQLPLIAPPTSLHRQLEQAFQDTTTLQQAAQAAALKKLFEDLQAQQQVAVMPEAKPDEMLEAVVEAQAAENKVLLAKVMELTQRVEELRQLTERQAKVIVKIINKPAPVP